MNFKIILIISIFFLTACQNTNNKKDLPNTKQTTTDIFKKTPKLEEVVKEEESNQGFITDQKYRNIGFALIYDEGLIEENQINKKIDNTVLGIFHKKI
jgi:hypothetical protein